MKRLFEEKFLGKLDQDWAWVHEQPGAWKIIDGSLHLRTLPGTLWADANNAHNFLLRPAVNWVSGFATRVIVCNEPQLMGEQAGLIWYNDDDNYIKLVKESLEGEQWIVLAREEEGQPLLINKTRISSQSAELQLRWIDHRVHGQFRLSPEMNWQSVGECALLADGDPKVGLFTHGGPEAFERWVEFRDFLILKS
jgi:hypothetical protein